MPATQILFYQDENGVAPVVEWFADLRRTDAQSFANCLARVRMLARMGHELRRPAADYLRDGIYELRAKRGRVQFRLLYFFHGRDVAVIGHAFIKRRAAVPGAEIERALRRSRTEPRGTYLSRRGDG